MGAPAGWEEAPTSSAPEGWTDTPPEGWEEAPAAETPPVNIKSKKALGTFQEQMLAKMIAEGKVGGSPEQVKEQVKSAKRATGLGSAIDRSKMGFLDTAADLAKFGVEGGQFLYDAGRYGLKSAANLVLGGGEAIRQGDIDAGLRKYTQGMENFKPSEPIFQEQSGPTEILGNIIAPAEKALMETEAGQADPALSQKIMYGLGLAGLRSPAKNITAKGVWEGTKNIAGKVPEAIDTGAKFVEAFKSPEKLKESFRAKYNEFSAPRKNQAKTAAERQKYFDDGELAMDEMLNQEKTGRIAPRDSNLRPNIIDEFDRVAQAKENVFKEYDAMAREATGKGMEVAPDDIIHALEKDAMSTGAKEFKGYQKAAQDAIDQLREEGNLTPEMLQEKIKALNAKISSKQFMSENYNQARIDAIKLDAYRTAIDNLVENSVGEGYAGLKKRYGALKAYEKSLADVVNRSDRGKWSPSMRDAFAAAEMVYGVTGNHPVIALLGVLNEARNVGNKVFGNRSAKLGSLYRKKGMNHQVREMGPMEYTAPEPAPVVPPGPGQPGYVPPAGAFNPEAAGQRFPSSTAGEGAIPGAEISMESGAMPRGPEVMNPEQMPPAAKPNAGVEELSHPQQMTPNDLSFMERKLSDMGYGPEEIKAFKDAAVKGGVAAGIAAMLPFLKRKTGANSQV